MPTTGGGAAWKRKPLAGSWSSPDRCSAIGMPAASSAVCTGRDWPLVSSTPDVELGAWPAPGGGGLPGQVVAELGAGQTGIGDHAVTDLVAQLD